MTKPFTPNDLLRFVYGEMPALEEEAFHAYLLTQPDLFQEYLSIRESMRALDASFKQPSLTAAQVLRKAKKVGLEKV
ncbi:hypothetical protein A3SI_06004 [Nitritalea halalkaliphila LW7]|uniref:Uncharacterized protein n=1 Tax=Nitritalea halalkaliphila LW7 TaxID=1189621 RepID=I5C7A7_9BACT|nr:hypothetical protein [Nitritalea halalkaliphila]EIM77709.1 hypothetical protein A3SI_06004 [Nitritalea halalkaliphila LW7]